MQLCVGLIAIEIVEEQRSGLLRQRELAEEGLRSSQLGCQVALTGQFSSACCGLSPIRITFEIFVLFAPPIFQEHLQNFRRL